MRRRYIKRLMAFGIQRNEAADLWMRYGRQFWPPRLALPGRERRNSMIIEILTLAALIEWIVLGVLVVKSIRSACRKICVVGDTMLGEMQSGGEDDG